MASNWNCRRQPGLLAADDGARAKRAGIRLSSSRFRGCRKGAAGREPPLESSRRVVLDSLIERWQAAAMTKREREGDEARHEHGGGGGGYCAESRNDDGGGRNDEDDDDGGQHLPIHHSLKWWWHLVPLAPRNLPPWHGGHHHPPPLPPLHHSGLFTFTST